MRKRRGALLATVGMLLAGAVGCTPTITPEGKKLCDDGLVAFNEGRYQQTVAYMDAFLKDYAQTSAAGRAWYLRGQAKFKLQDHAGARADFEQATKVAKDKTVLANAHAALADIAWDADDMKQAELQYRNALAYSADDLPPADQALYRLGCVLQRVGRWEDADKYFSRVEHFFPNSPLAERAAKRINQRMWTVQAAAYRNRKLALARAAALRRQNVPAEVRTQTGLAQPLFVVQVGRYQTFEQARATLGDVRRHAQDAFVTVTR